jgi:hypothetical protein
MVTNSAYQSRLVGVWESTLCPSLELLPRPPWRRQLEGHDTRHVRQARRLVMAYCCDDRRWAIREEFLADHILGHGHVLDTQNKLISDAI